MLRRRTSLGVVRSRLVAERLARFRLVRLYYRVRTGQSRSLPDSP
jgi:hypothetical protein